MICVIGGAKAVSVNVASGGVMTVARTIVGANAVSVNVASGGAIVVI